MLAQRAQQITTAVRPNVSEPTVAQMRRVTAARETHDQRQVERGRLMAEHLAVKARSRLRSGFASPRSDGELSPQRCSKQSEGDERDRSVKAMARASSVSFERKGASSRSGREEELKRTSTSPSPRRRCARSKELALALLAGDP